MRIYAINSQYHNRIYNKTSFRGGKEEVLSEGLKEFVSDALPIYKTGRAMQSLANDDPKGAIKQTVGLVDNIVCQPVKQMTASAVAAKGALIGSVLGPGGAVIGAAAGYIGTLWGWGKARNSLTDVILDD